MADDDVPESSQATASPSPDDASPPAPTTATPSSPTPVDTSFSSSSSTQPPATLDQARLFLRNDAVRRQPRPRKAAFLAGKGLTSDQVDLLLAGDASEDVLERPQNAEVTENAEDSKEANTAEDTEHTSPQDQTPQTLTAIPPIVTYPEFLARPAPPQRPPPLVTPAALVRAIYGGAVASTLLYGGTKRVLAPMVDALTDARVELHATAGAHLAHLLERLGGVVSEVPASKKLPERALSDMPDVATDDSSDTSDAVAYDDPTEVFHRDVGVQTSPPPSPDPSRAADPANNSSPPPSPPSAAAVQALRLEGLVASLDRLRSHWTNAPAPIVLADLHTTLNTLREDVDRLGRPPAYALGSSFLNLGGYSTSGSSGAESSNGIGGGIPGNLSSISHVATTRNEPNDEIRKAKENIRRVKGALLTARTFPTVR